MGKNRNLSLLIVLIPSDSTGSRENLTKTYNTKAEIHDHVINYNIAHYPKAEQSPVGIKKPLYHKIRLHGTLAFCDRVLIGQLTIQDMEEIPLQQTSELLQTTLKPIDISNPHKSKLIDISVDLNHKDCVKMFSKWKEKTTILPSGRHLGHYKPISHYPELIQYHCIMSTSPLTFGFAPSK